jgi:hypothetical protein
MKMAENANKYSAADGVTQTFDFCHGTPLMVRAADFNALYRRLEAVTAEAQENKRWARTAQADAERYRWMRAEHERHDPICHLSWKRNGDRSSGEWVNTACLDVSIDLAMQAAREPGVMQHPLGPWRVVSNADGWRASYEGNGCSAYQAIVDAYGIVIALAVDKQDDHSEPMPERQSGLLAAAPELLKCLRSLYHAPLGQGDYAAAGELLKRLGAA